MNKIEYGTEFLDQLKDSVHDLYDENKELKTENRFQMKLIEEMNKNNDRLNKENTILMQNSQYLVKQKDELEEEIERLNNIINEYDKWLESEIKRLEKIQNPKRGVKPYGQEYNNYTLLIGAYDNVLDKLRKLKGIDKE